MWWYINQFTLSDLVPLAKSPDMGLFLLQAVLHELDGLLHRPVVANGALQAKYLLEKLRNLSPLGSAANTSNSSSQPRGNFRNTSSSSNSTHPRGNLSNTSSSSTPGVSVRLYRGQGLQEVMHTGKDILMRDVARLADQAKKVGTWERKVGGCGWGLSFCQHRQLLSWLQRLMERPMPGDDGIVECLVYFKARGHHVCLVTEDQLLRQRVDAQGVPSAGLKEWEQYIEAGQLWF